MNYTEMN